MHTLLRRVRLTMLSFLGPSCSICCVMQAQTLDAVEDLEEDAKPEDLMLSYVSGDKSKVSRRKQEQCTAITAVSAQWSQQQQQQQHTR